MNNAIVVYHGNPRLPLTAQGQSYLGSDRELLSEFLGGRVGFAYLDFPDCWGPKNGVVEVILPPDVPIILALKGEDVPRRNYIQATFIDILADENLYYLGLAADLSQFRGNPELGELVFLADGRARFGNFV